MDFSTSGYERERCSLFTTGKQRVLWKLATLILSPWKKPHFSRSPVFPIERLEGRKRTARFHKLFSLLLRHPLPHPLPLVATCRASPKQQRRRRRRSLRGLRRTSRWPRRRRAALSSPFPPLLHALPVSSLSLNLIDSILFALALIGRGRD